MSKLINYFSFLLFCLSGIQFALAAPAMDPLKVAYLYNIAKFTRWPEKVWPNQSAPFQLCFYGDNDLADALQVLLTKNINGHPIVLLKPKYEPEFKQCHAFYIDTLERHRYRYLLSLIDQELVLVVSDDSPFFASGGLVNLVEKNQRLRFQINTQELERSQLQFSSKLLELAILIDNQR